MDAFDFFAQGKFKTLSGLNKAFFIMQFAIALFSVLVAIIITYTTFFQDMYMISLSIILLGIVLGFLLKLIAFNFIGDKKHYFLANLFPLYTPKIIFPSNPRFLNKNMRYMYLLWMFSWHSVSWSIYQVKNGEGGLYYFVIIFFGLTLPIINYLMFLRFEYYKLFGKE